MKKIFYILGFCCLLALSFTACQQEEDALEQINQEEIGLKEDEKEEVINEIED